MGRIALFFKHNWKWIVLLLIAILLIAYIRRNWYKFSQLFHPRDIDLEPGETLEITPEREKYIESIAQRLYSDIYNTPWTGHNGDIYEEALGLTDNELFYMTKFYKRSVSGGNSLAEDIQGELYPFTDSPTTLMARLNKIGAGY